MADRRFSLEEDFMHFGTNDLLFAFMRSLSTARPLNAEELKTARPNEKYKEYLPIATYKKNRKVIANICGVSTRTIDNQLNKLAEAGLVDEGIEICGNKEVPCFWFPFDYDKNYKLIDKEFLQYLIDTRNPHSIRIYLYLLNKYGFKKDYNFTIKEISMALGYAESTKAAYSTINNVLKSFAREGIIKYKDISVEIETKEGTLKLIPNKQLIFVAQSEAELRRI